MVNTSLLNLAHGLSYQSWSFGLTLRLAQWLTDRKKNFHWWCQKGLPSLELREIYTLINRVQKCNLSAASLHTFLFLFVLIIVHLDVKFVCQHIPRRKCCKCRTQITSRICLFNVTNCLKAFCVSGKTSVQSYEQLYNVGAPQNSSRFLFYLLLLYRILSML